MDLFDDASYGALGAVVEQGRGAAPFGLVHGEAAVACAAWALGEARITIVDLGSSWDDLVEAELPLVVHDAVCPMTPVAFLRDCVTACVERDAVVVGVGPDGAVWSPVVVPSAVLAQLDGERLASALRSPDLAAVVELLDEVGGAVHRASAPPEARPVRTDAERRDLERSTAPEHQQC